jgi:predicted metal-dependent phosphoesterase TrpH
VGGMVRLDLHNHTSHSADGFVSPRRLLEIVRERGIDCVAITDHNTVSGALEAAAEADSDPSLPRVIPGLELLTDVGEIIGFYVSENIPKGLPVLAAIERLRAQGALVCLPHPHDRLRRGAIAPAARQMVAEAVDIIEVVNGRALGPWSNRRSLELARRLGKPQSAGSDAHNGLELARAYMTVAEQPTRETLLGLLAAGAPGDRLNTFQYARNWVFQSISPVTRITRRLGGRTAG